MVGTPSTGLKQQLVAGWARRARRVALALLLGGVLSGMALIALPTPRAHASCAGDMQFIITATAANTSGYITTLDSPVLNGIPAAAPLVTQLWPDQYDPHPLGVWYSPYSGKWTVFNEDLAAMPLGTSFSVGSGCIGNDGTSTVERFTATSSNVQGDAVFIDDSTTNGNPSAVVYASQAWTGTYNAHEIGVYYNGSAAKWAIYNLDLSAMPVGASFDIWTGQTAAWPSTLTVTASTSNIVNGYELFLNDARFNNQPGLAPMVSQYYGSTPCLKGHCVINNHTIGIWYDGAVGQWVIYNVDQAPIPLGARFFMTADI